MAPNKIDRGRAHRASNVVEEHSGFAGCFRLHDEWNLFVVHRFSRIADARLANGERYCRLFSERYDSEVAR